MMVRTRFAPSPTGYMHIGNLRTALYTYLLTRSMNGTFVLRIEDTDQERYVEGAVDVIYNTLRDAGLSWDEGPDVGGDYGPYVQSERRGIYKEYAEKLVELGGAYYCFCDSARLEGLRAAAEAAKLPPKYDGLCRNLDAAEVERKLREGASYVVRQKMPLEGTTSFNDAVFGTITVENATLDDNVLLKSDGLPTYNFANVVDDHLMNVTHIIRGNEYLSSTPKYNLLYQSFGWDIPQYIHVSPVMKEHGKKLSKRDGDASYEDFIAKGYLKEAIINYIALLGWSPQSEREIFALEELVKEFSVEGISKSPAIFDENKLLWLNGEYIRAMSANEFYEKAKPWLQQGIKNTEIDLRAVSELIQPRTARFCDIPEQVDFFDALPEYDVSLFNHKKMKTSAETAAVTLREVLAALRNIDDWRFEPIHDAMIGLAERLGLKNGQVMYPTRVALSGKEFTPGGAIEIAAILGKEGSLSRIEGAVIQLGS